MAVMKTFCGCCSTKSGSLAILGFNLLMYTGGIIVAAMRVGNPDTSWAKDIEVPKECGMNSTSDFKDSWWCNGLSDSTRVEEEFAIGKLVVNIVLLICSILGVYGVTSDISCPMLPCLVGEFLVWMLLTLMAGSVVLVLVIYSPGDVDMSTSVSVGVLVLMFIVFWMYLWLCLLSHYQTLKEIEGIGIDKVQPIQYPYDDDVEQMKVDTPDPHYGDYPTARTDVSPPPAYSPPPDALPDKPDNDDIPDVEDINLDDKLP